ncbi:MAG: hypothetical protein MJ168_02065 [Clostridia bacterium]|nr:hypothetical protein [Clostridia bacterium]
MADKIKRFSKILITALLIICLSCASNYLIVPISYAHWAKHDVRELTGKIDTLIIGDSLPLYSIQPSILDKRKGCCSFNTSSPSQFMDETYYLLLDFIKEENIKTVYLGLDYYNFLQEAEEGNRISAQIVYKRLRNPSVKIDYLKKFFNFDEAWEWIFQERNNVNGIAHISNTVKAKLSDEYRNYLPLSNEEFLLEGGTYYYDKGYVRTDSCDAEYVEGVHDMKDLSCESIEWYKKIIELCKSNGIELYIFHTPLKKNLFNATANYDTFYKTVQEIAESYGCPYYDFNYHPDRNTISDDTDFVNDSHLNYQGSLKLMDWLCKEF